MMEVSKIHLSPAEIELMQNAQIILTKNRVLEKIKGLLEDVQEKQIHFMEGSKNASPIFNVPPKISRGENYSGLPYLILDYPRRASANEFFFIRTMFWWGNFFSCTLHLAGDSKQYYKKYIQEAYRSLQEHLISSTDNPWVHDLTEAHYCKISAMNSKQFAENCERFDHIKIARKHELAEWEKASPLLYEDWKFFLSVCKLIP
jgi:hypothetical protein